MATAPETDPWDNPNPGTPWIPSAVGVDLRDVPRGTQHYWAKQISGLPGEFVYPIFNARLLCAIAQVPSETTDATEPYQSVPETGYYETIDSVEVFLQYAKLLGEQKLIKFDLDHPTSYALRLSINLYANAYSQYNERRIDLPSSDHGYRGEHTVRVENVSTETLFFRHNWDGWTRIWSMPLEYVRKEFIQAHYLGRIRQDASLSFDFQSEVVAPTSVKVVATSSGSWLGSHQAVARIFAIGGASLLLDRREYQLFTVVERGGKQVLAGWVIFHLSKDQAEVSEIFVLPPFRSMGVATSMIGILAFHLHVTGWHTIVFVKSRADISVNEFAPEACVTPSWMVGDWEDCDVEHAKSTVRKQKRRFSTMELVEACVAPMFRNFVKDTGIVSVEHYGIYSDEPQRIDIANGPQLVLDPSIARIPEGADLYRVTGQPPTS